MVAFDLFATWWLGKGNLQLDIFIPGGSTWIFCSNGHELKPVYITGRQITSADSVVPSLRWCWGYDFRMSQLKAMETMLTTENEKMAAALATDMNRPDFESETFEAPQRWPNDSGRAGFGFGLGFVSISTRFFTNKFQRLYKRW